MNTKKLEASQEKDIINKFIEKTREKITLPSKFSKNVKLKSNCQARFFINLQISFSLSFTEV